MPDKLDCVLCPKKVDVGQSFEVKLTTDYRPQPGKMVYCMTACESRGGTKIHLAGDLRSEKFENGAFSFKLKFIQKAPTGVTASSLAEFGYSLPFDIVVDGAVEASTNVKIVVK
jgi:hypothetical protein